MAKHVYDNDVSTIIVVNESNSTWVLEKGVTASGGPGFYNHDYDNVTFLLSGRIQSQQMGLHSWRTNSNEGTDDVSVKLTSTGRIDAVSTAVVIEGDRSDIDNDGLIRSQDFGAVALRHGQDVALINSGRILAPNETAVRLDDVQSFSVENSGRIRTGEGLSAIEGQFAGSGSIINAKGGKIAGSIIFEDATGDITVTNRGKIAQGVGANHDGVTLGDGDDRLVNRGLIGGDVSFGNGDDYGDFRKGNMGGAYIIGGDGDDTFVVSNTSSKIFEFGSGGSDTIKTTVNYSLGNLIWDHIEILEAIGKKNISLGGNDQDNVLRGNVGNNAMSGGGGNDILAGFGGRDTLSGDAGADHFFFYTKGGIDTITDFTVDMDVIHIIEVSGIDDFTDLKSRMSSVDFDGDVDVDTVIDLGGGSRIRLTDVAKGDLEMSDFSIFPV
jgi:Ca2+-binding RTX toxin-like protein